MADTGEDYGEFATAVLAFTLPAAAFASLFGFRYVEEPAVAAVRLDLIAVALTAAAATLAGVRHAGRAVPALGKATVIALTVVDVMITIGATVSVSDIYRSHAPYLVGWIIDVAALVWVGAAAMVLRRGRLHRA